MYQELTNRLREALAAHIQEKYGVALAIVLERPPKIEMGEAASPVCFELAKRLKRAPRQIAQEIAGSLGKVDGIARVEVAGGAYLNAYFDRGAFWESTQREASATRQEVEGGREKIIVEHTSINPNKAAHIGHVRNAVLGDTMVRILRHAGHRVQIQNYIDNTGVQVADVVIGFLRMEQRTITNVMTLAKEPKFDYYCWDLYAKATNFFAEDAERAGMLRAETLKAIEENRGEDAEVAQVVADTIVSCHLRTMARLDIYYDLLARESEILHLKFWDAAFEMLKKSGAIHLAASGKMAGCWVLPWREDAKDADEVKEVKGKSTEEDEENEQDKIIVRSNGTVTYVGKDIAYQLWKFGLLGKDFHYKKWPDVPEGETVWATTSRKGDPDAPHFGEAAATVYNVIDTRQTYPQKVVAEGLRRLGHPQEADNSIHLSYERVTLTPRCAAEMGYELSPDEAKKPYVEVSGRKGFGVKADDLMDKLEAATLGEVQQRHPEMNEDEQKRTAHAIAVGALRFFLLKFTRNAIIAFDFKDALSFEGETGPYCQYAVVRIRGIRRKGAEGTVTSAAVTPEFVGQILASAEGTGLWELVLAAGSLDYAVDAAIATQEPAFVAKYAFQLAQAFNLFYHKHHILSEADEQKRAFLLRLTELAEAQLVRALSLLGIKAPERM
ncbi:MAG: arginine--tRNA ligase [Acidobacteria bacterium 13_1_40CM_4_58_4]|nr:MAG: arginine--tRNA ligase [Acidobacteria bacterium 13_1_40CM_4_58_4]